MRLKQIKLAGFKSFVEPTKVPFEQQMTAIVGPNGCGKSNIIDAVRWVLGESSAKHLRGDAMTDVIFNGAANRKAVGQASVELFFDNVDQRLQGSLADRQQVAIRRVVNRDGQNSYFLNGTKCRRKDITDIFLGTGLGPRSYAIIEQGTISRLIESKPQELRQFIEEAAGISKYKERRRETEVRIRHTRENLDRLSDIRYELAQQLETLDQQAQAAKSFKTLKKQQRHYRAELAYMRWQKQQENVIKTEQAIALHQSQLEEVEQRLNKLDTAQEAAKQHREHQSMLIAQYQGEKLELATCLASTKQQVTYQSNLADKLAKQQQEQASNIATFKNELPVLEEQLVDLEKELTENLKTQQQLKEKVSKSTTALLQCQQHTQALEQQWQTLNQQNRAEKETTLAHAEQLAQLKTDIAINEQNVTTLQSQLAKPFEHSEQHSDELEKSSEQLAVKIDALSSQLAEKKEQVKTLEQKLFALLGEKNKSQVLAEQNQQRLDKLLNELNSLNCQSDSKGKTVAELLEIEPKWQQAVEMVLGHFLSAKLVSFDHIVKKELPSASLVVNAQSLDYNFEVNPSSLAAKVSGCQQILPLLNNVLTASDEEQCIAHLATLKKSQSVICPQGIWLSERFMQNGLLLEENRYIDIQKQINSLTPQIPHLLATEQQLEQQLKQKHLELNALKAEINKKEQQFIQLTAEQQTLKQQLLAANQQHVAETEKRQQAQQQLTTLLDKQVLLADKLSELNAQQQNHPHEQSNLLMDLHAELAAVRAEQERQQRYLSEHQNKLHITELAFEKCHFSQQQKIQQQQRAQDRIEGLNQQLFAIVQQQNDLLDLPQKKSTLTEQINEMAALEQKLSQAQQHLTQSKAEISEFECKSLSLTAEQNNIHQLIHQDELALQKYQLKSAEAFAQFNETGVSFSEVEKNLPDRAKESRWQSELTVIDQQLKKLGAINLAAIDEFERKIQRKNYLDQQDQDLNHAISTLESAIAKIDNESRQKFKSTFEQVNQDLQQLFPKVFDGGSAYLELTSDELLETGVSIMARPPGKKNSTIHLLSGGEKALTALSLVFAIFRLNPAPFCMLDEVDAPLDDVNVARFCKLVKEMSQNVQFIYISHNKIAMEMASHLTGVTMVEPGVSRMVAVDIDEAMAMAEVS